MKIEKAATGVVGTNQYLVEEDGLWVIDAPDGNEGFVEALKERTEKLSGILLTHGHFDHTIGLENLLKAFPGTPVYLDRNDWYMLRDKEKGNPYFLRRMGIPAAFWPDLSGIPLLPYPETIGPFRVLHTPGHTMGSVCLLSKGMLFSGDTLFRGGEGRTDIGGDYRSILVSLHRLMELPPETKVLPGHGEDTTIGLEAGQRYR